MKLTLPIPENAIIINGVVYVLVDNEDSNYKDCMGCALCYQCESPPFLCNLLDRKPLGKHFKPMEAKASPWKSVYSNKYPEGDEPVVGFWSSGKEPEAALCYHDKMTNEWFDCDRTTDYGNNGKVDVPDYWIERPDKEVVYDGED